MKWWQWPLQIIGVIIALFVVLCAFLFSCGCTSRQVVSPVDYAYGAGRLPSEDR